MTEVKPHIELRRLLGLVFVYLNGTEIAYFPEIASSKSSNAIKKVAEALGADVTETPAP